MRCKPIRLLLFALWLVAAGPAAHAQLLDGILEGIGVLPVNTANLDSFYAELVFEVFARDGSSVAAQGEHYYVRGESPDSPPLEITITEGKPQVSRGDMSGTAVLNPPLELFFRNYELRITGVDYRADRLCHVIDIVARKDARRVRTYCIDAETGLALGYETYDADGTLMTRGTVTYFEPNPDLSGLDFGELEPEAEGEAITVAELQAMVPWLQLPERVPEGYELIGVLLTGHNDLPVDMAIVVYSDGLEQIGLSILLWPEFVENPDPRLLEEYVVDEDAPVAPTAASLIYYGKDQPTLVMMALASSAAGTDLADMLWALLPGEK